MVFKNRELKRIVLSILILSIAFMYSYFRDIGFIIFSISLGFVSLSFICKEIFRKEIAREFSYKTEYKIWAPGSVIALISSIFPLVFAFPGYTELKSEYYETLKRKSTLSFYTFELTQSTRKGLINLMGILASLVLGTVFLGLTSPGFYFMGYNIFLFAAYINFTLAIFNLLPIHPLNGLGIMNWRASIWVASMLLTCLGLARVLLIL